MWLFFPGLGFEIVECLLELAFKIGGQFAFCGKVVAEIACGRIDVCEEGGLEFLNAGDRDVVQISLGAGVNDHDFLLDGHRAGIAAA